jgi:hypothetical protein
MASFDGLRLPREACNHDRKITFFRHKQRGKARRVSVDDDARRRYLHKAMRRYLHKAMIKASGLQLLEGQDCWLLSPGRANAECRPALTANTQPRAAACCVMYWNGAQPCNQSASSQQRTAQLHMHIQLHRPSALHMVHRDCFNCLCSS